MATKRARFAHNYQQLHNIFSVVLWHTQRQERRKTYPKAYSVERIIRRRNSGNVSVI